MLAKTFLLLVISVFFLTISAMYISAVNSCKSKDTKQIVFNPSSYKFGVFILVIAILCAVGSMGFMFFLFTPPGRAMATASSLV